MRGGIAFLISLEKKVGYGYDSNLLKTGFIIDFIVIMIRAFG